MANCSQLRTSRCKHESQTLNISCVRGLLHLSIILSLVTNVSKVCAHIGVVDNLMFVFFSEVSSEDSGIP